MNKKKPNTDKTSIAIVGGGLAGTLLSAHLIEKGQQVTLIDDNREGAASQVAAGLYNVVTGRFGAKSWMADALLPALKRFLRNHPFLASFDHPIDIYRPFKEIAEYNKWSGRVEDPVYRDLVRFQEKPFLPEKINNDFGGIFVTPCGWIDVPGMVGAMIGQMQTQASFKYISAHLPYEAIDLPNKELVVNDREIPFDHLVFCEGYRAKDNLFFQGIPIIPNKGEILEIESPSLQLDIVISRKIYAIPLGENRYVVGSSYQNRFEHPGPTAEGKAEICDHLEKAIKVPYRILDHRAGIRPTTPDRKPILGTHEEHSFVHICTGFGTKGLLLGPYFTKMLAEAILDPAQDKVRAKGQGEGQGEARNIIPEVDLKRFRKKFNLK